MWCKGNCHQLSLAHGPCGSQGPSGIPPGHPCCCNTKQRRGDITGRNAKYALDWFYHLLVLIKLVDITAHVQRPFSERFYLPVISVRFFRSSNTAQSGVLAVIPCSYTCKGKLVAT